MEKCDEIYGASSKIYIQFQGTLQELGLRLQNGLSLHLMRYENMEDEPYSLVGYAEVFGFEIQLKSISDTQKWRDYHFVLEATTTDCFKEIFNDQMFDISHWMARYISLVCDVTTLAENKDRNSGQSFSRNKVTSKRESNFVIANSVAE